MDYFVFLEVLMNLAVSKGREDQKFSDSYSKKPHPTEFTILLFSVTLYQNFFCCLSIYNGSNKDPLSIFEENPIWIFANCD